MEKYVRIMMQRKALKYLKKLTEYDHNLNRQAEVSIKKFLNRKNEALLFT